MNVKRGDCSIIEHNSGHISVIDICNGNDNTQSLIHESIGNFNMKAHPISPIEYLKKNGVKNIFRFIVTHPDMDHIDGIFNLYNEIGFTNFWDTDNDKLINEFDFTSYNEEDWIFYQKLHNNQDKNVTRLVLYNGSKGKYYNETENGELGGDGITIIYPYSNDVKKINDTENYNDISYVILYRTFDKKILFCGDSEKFAWDRILQNNQDKLKNIDVLLAPHHGRKSGGNDDYLDILKPKLTIFGNAKSSDLDYSSFNNRRLKYYTKNETGNIILDFLDKTIYVYVQNKKFAEKENTQTKENQYGWLINYI